MASSAREIFPAMVYCLLSRSARGVEIVSIWEYDVSHRRSASPSPFGTPHQRAVRVFVDPRGGTTPSCCIMPKASQLLYESMIFPPATWCMVIPSTDTFLFVAGIPM